MSSNSSLPDGEEKDVNVHAEHRRYVTKATRWARWINSRQRTAIALTVVGVISSFAGSLLSILELTRRQPTIQERASKLSQSLTEATELIDQMQADISNRQALVTKLQQDLDTYNKLAALKREEVEAVAQVLRLEIERDSRRSFWEGVAVNFTFFVLGAAASWFITRLQSRRGDALVLENGTK